MNSIQIDFNLNPIKLKKNYNLVWLELNWIQSNYEHLVVKRHMLICLFISMCGLVKGKKSLVLELYMECFHNCQKTILLDVILISFKFKNSNSIYISFIILLMEMFLHVNFPTSLKTMVLNTKKIKRRLWIK